MKRILVVVSFTLVALVYSGCSGSGSDTSDSANANTVAEVSTFTDAKAALAEGIRLFDENQIEAAIQVLKQAVTLDPDLAEAHFNLGVAYALLEMQMAQTGAVSQPALDADGKKTNKTNSELAFEKAVDAYKKLLEKNPDDDVAHYYLGRTYSKLLKDEQAEEEFRQAVKLKPDDTEYQTELGAVLIKLANYRQAIGPLKRAIELDETNDRAIALLEDAEAGRQRVDYVSAKSNSNQANANTANTNTEANLTSNSTPAGNAKSTPTAKPATTPTGPQREVPRSRIANPAANRPDRSN